MKFDLHIHSCLSPCANLEMSPSEIVQRAVAALMTVAVILSFVGPLRAVLPDIHRFWLVDAFAGGCTPAGADLCAAAGAGALLVAFWLVAGSALLARREIP